MATKITKAQFVTNFKAAEARAVPSSAGVAFTVEDRLILNSQRIQLGLSTYQASKLVGGDYNTTQRNEQRFRVFDYQVANGVIRMQAAPTGEHVGKVRITSKGIDDHAFDGRIKSTADIQPAFNRAARQLIKVGVTSSAEAFKYINTAFETARIEQKIDLKAERIVKELQMGDLTKDQVMATLERVKQSF